MYNTAIQQFYTNTHTNTLQRLLFIIYAWMCWMQPWWIQCNALIHNKNIVLFRIIHINSYHSAWRHNMDTGFSMWSFNGRLIAKFNTPKFFEFQWRPRPASMLTAGEEKLVLKNMKWVYYVVLVCTCVVCGCIVVLLYCCSVLYLVCGCIVL